MATMDKVFAGHADRQRALASSENRFAKGIAYIEGNYVPLGEARIPLMDQGFLHSDLTYDVPGVWDGRFFRLEDHLTRFEASCAKLHLRNPLPRNELRRILVEMCSKSGIRDAYVELIVTRGLKGVRGNKLEDLTNNVYLLIQPWIWVQEPKVQRVGGRAIVARTVRRTPPGSMDPTVKNLQWGDLTRGLIEAENRDASFPFLTDGDANLTEGAGYNVFLVKGKKLYTPDRGVLEGITRQTVFDIAKTKNIEVRVEVIPVELCFTCDECFMSTTAGGIMPITFLDGAPINDGKIGPVTKSIWDAYWALHYDDNYSFKVEYEAENTKAKL